MRYICTEHCYPQATAAAAQQYADVQALISELVIGKEPAFTESVMNRFASAYYTAVPAAISSVQSYASEQYVAASSVAGERVDGFVNDTLRVLLPLVVNLQEGWLPHDRSPV